MSAKQAVEHEISELPEEIRDSGLAASALIIATALDEATSRDVAGLARELRTTLAALREVANANVGEEDEVTNARNSVASRFADSDSQDVS